MNCIRGSGARLGLIGVPLLGTVSSGGAPSLNDHGSALSKVISPGKFLMAAFGGHQGVYLIGSGLMLYARIGSRG